MGRGCVGRGWWEGVEGKEWRGGGKGVEGMEGRSGGGGGRGMCMGGGWKERMEGEGLLECNTGRERLRI